MTRRSALVPRLSCMTYCCSSTYRCGALEFNVLGLSMHGPNHRMLSSALDSVLLLLVLASLTPMLLQERGVAFLAHFY